MHCRNNNTKIHDALPKQQHKIRDALPKQEHKIHDALPRQQHNNPWATPRAESHHNSDSNLAKQQQQQTQTDHDTDHKPKTISDTGPETPKLLILILPQNYLVYFPLSPSPENY